MLLPASATTAAALTTVAAANNNVPLEGALIQMHSPLLYDR